MVAIVVHPQLTFDDAHALTDHIKETVESVWEMLQKAHDGKGWNPLGYASWANYVRTELDMGRSRSYQILDQAEVIKPLTDAASNAPVSTTVDTPVVTERQARRIKPKLKEAVAEVREAVAKGATPGDAVDAVLKTYEQLPSSEVADAMSRETGQEFMYPADDGYFHDGKSKEEKDVIAGETRQIFLLVRAIQELDEIERDPAEFLAKLPDFMRYQVDLHLKTAVTWLNEFQELYTEE